MLKREDLFHEEKLSLLLYMKYKVFLSAADVAGKIKNIEDAKTSRNLGNELYKRRSHNALIHHTIFYHYTRSIAFAPINSEDLAMGYGNRSALFFHLKSYEDCLIDIERAISISCDNLLKVKLLCRKAESLKMLNKSKKCEQACQAGLQILEQLNDSKKNVFATKFNQLLSNQNSIKKTDIKLPKKDSYFDDLLNFERSEEMPTVSKSVSIKYNKKWGRHIVATEDIKPGEIISIQKCIFIQLDNEVAAYSSCSYCYTSTYNTVPCEFCIYDIYCSEKCCVKAWNEYHKYECIIYQHSTTLDSIHFMRFVLSAIYEAGGIEKMKEHILEIENNKDPQTKGLSKGVFYTECKRNIFSLKKTYAAEMQSYKVEYCVMADICNYIYLLAKFTNFFGDKINILEPEVLLDEDRLFIAAMILRTQRIILANGEMITKSPLLVPDHVYVELFNCMINHQCHSNVRILRVDGGRSITYACLPIRKGSQLFKNFQCVNFDTPKKIRQQILKKYGITCKCIACMEDWSVIAEPTIEELIRSTPTLDISIVQKNRILLERINIKHGVSIFTAELFKQVCQHLADLAEKFTVVCSDYYQFLAFIEYTLFRVYSESNSEILQKCN